MQKSSKNDGQMEAKTDPKGTPKEPKGTPKGSREEPKGGQAVGPAVFSKLFRKKLSQKPPETQTGSEIKLKWIQNEAEAVGPAVFF